MMEILFFLGVIFLAGFTQGLTGFGSILISVSILAMLMDLKLIIPLVSLFALCINFMLVVRLYSHVRWRTELLMLACTIPGVFLGVYALRFFPVFALEILLGMVLILFTAYLLWYHPVPRTLSPIWTGIAGFSAGCLGGSIGANGPPVILYTAMQPWTKSEIKATMVAYFLLAGLGISGMHWYVDLITAKVIRLFFMGLPVLVIGVLVGSAFFGRIPETIYRRIVLLFLLVLGFIMIARHIAAW